MAEEFQEYEVIFQENVLHQEVQKLADDDEEYDFQIRRNNKVSRIKKLKRNSNSVPVNIPDKTSWFKYVEKKANFFQDDDDDDDDDEIVPPHVITGRRIAGKMMAFSVCTGNGRTLKGRDLSQVRNSILKMTGFLET
ncbi:protein S40-1-like [Lycium barbarum]|uniref:protein S40-1-like n=1 Tax=Lycium barbarum TaxID=112863 RepID=UPI00293E720D|nr:protein S40-1-like [Lycium barbarum]